MEEEKDTKEQNEVEEEVEDWDGKLQRQKTKRTRT